MARAQEWLSASDAHWSHERKTWTFPSGATLTFGYLDNENDVYRYQSAEFQYIGFDELTQFTERQYTYLFSRLRRTEAVPIPLRMRAASNPGGIGHGWVKARFIDKREKHCKFIPAGLVDNPHVNRESYTDSLSELNPILQQQLLDGDWGAFEGAAFTLTSDHLIDPVELMSNWERFESMDYGLTNPTAWLAWAVDYDGNLISFGSHYQPGMPSETAPIILKYRQSWRSSVCYGDPASLAMPTSTVNRFGQPSTIESEFADHGLPLVRANNDPRRGYTRLRELLRLDDGRRFPDWHPRRGENGSPRWFIVERSNQELVDQLRTAPLQPIEQRWAGEMIDPKWESAYGHAVAAARYGAMSRPSPSEQPPQLPDDPRARLLYEIEQKRDRGSSSTRYELV